RRARWTRDSERGTINEKRETSNVLSAPYSQSVERPPVASVPVGSCGYTNSVHSYNRNCQPGHSPLVVALQTENKGLKERCSFLVSRLSFLFPSLWSIVLYE